MSKFSSIIKNFPGVKVLIIGDVMLDRYWWGSVQRISPEAPVPVVNLRKESLVAGGAANVAANVSGLGAEPVLVGLTGKDADARLLSSVLKKSKIKPDFLLSSKSRSTIIKTRIVAHNQHVVRIDQEEAQNLTFEEENKIWNIIENNIDKVSIIIVSDYGKGLLTEEFLTRLITTTNEYQKPVFIDPKGKDYRKYAKATILTPNRFESAQAAHLDENGLNLVESAGNLLLRKYQLKSLLITEGEHGMTLFQKKSEPLHFEALARKVYDVTGAGDTVIASLAVAYGAGATLSEAAEIANIAAGLVVEEVGTTAITFEKLLEAVADR